MEQQIAWKFLIDIICDDKWPGGKKKHHNDYPLAISIAENYMGYAFQVKDYKEVWKVLKMGIR